MRTIRSLLLPTLALAVCGCVAVDDLAPVKSTDEHAWRSTNADVHERLAQKALADGRLDEAMTNASEALRIQGDREPAALVLARVQLLAGKPQEAERTLAQLLEHHDDCVEAWLLRGEAMAAQNRNAAARDAWRTAQERGSPQGALAQAAQSALDGETAAALAVLDASGVKSSIEPAVLKDAAAQWLASGDAMTAGTLFEAAATRDGDDAQLQQFVVRERALAGGPDPTGDSVEAKLTRAATMLRRGDAAAAAALYGALARELGDDVAVKIALGEALARSNDAAGAESSFRAATRLDPKASAAWLGIARVQLATQRPRDAVATLDDALRAAPEHVAVRSMLVAAAIAAGDVARARSEADKVREAAPGSVLDRGCRQALVAADAPIHAGGP